MATVSHAVARLTKQLIDAQQHIIALLQLIRRSCPPQFIASMIEIDPLLIAIHRLSIRKYNAEFQEHAIERRFSLPDSIQRQAQQVLSTASSEKSLISHVQTLFNYFTATLEGIALTYPSLDIDNHFVKSYENQLKKCREQSLLKKTIPRSSNSLYFIFETGDFALKQLQQLINDAKQAAIANEQTKLEAEKQRQIEEQAGVEAEKLQHQKEEQARIQAEKLQRQKEEQARIEAEKLQRQKDEQARIEAEKLQRQKEEQARIEAEKLQRQKEEQARIEAEKLQRQKDEQARIEAEKLQRQKEEQARIEAEKLQRQKEEQARIEAEKLQRQKDEQARIEAEKLQRQKDEQARIEAEKLQRQKDEQARIEAEKLQRQKDEQARIEAEATRIENERIEKLRKIEERLRQEEIRRDQLEKEKKELAIQEKQRLAEEKKREAKIAQQIANAEKLINSIKEKDSQRLNDIATGITSLLQQSEISLKNADFDISTARQALIHANKTISEIKFYLDLINSYIIPKLNQARKIANEPHTLPPHHIFNARHQQIADETQYQLNLHNSYMQKAKEIKEKAQRLSTSFDAKLAAQKNSGSYITSANLRNDGSADIVRQQIARKILLTPKNAESTNALYNKITSSESAAAANNLPTLEKNQSDDDKLVPLDRFDNYMRNYGSYLKTNGMKIANFLSQSQELIFALHQQANEFALQEEKIALTENHAKYHHDAYIQAHTEALRLALNFYHDTEKTHGVKAAQQLAQRIYLDYYFPENYKIVIKDSFDKFTSETNSATSPFFSHQKTETKLTEDHPKLKLVVSAIAGG